MHYARNNFSPIDPPVFKRRQKQITDWETLEDEMRGALDFNALSDDQKKVFEHVMQWYGPGAGVLTLGGYAGTGKSTLVSILARELERAGANGQFRIAFCAYTGKAANVLRQKLRQAGIHASIMGYPHYVGTIHSLIYVPVTGGSGDVIDWELKSYDEVADYGLIVVDEASMVDEKMLEDLRSYDVPILAVGDHDGGDAWSACAALLPATSDVGVARGSYSAPSPDVAVRPTYPRAATRQH